MSARTVSSQSLVFVRSMPMSKWRKLLAIGIPLAAITFLAILAIEVNGPSFIQEETAYAVAHNGVPMDSVACKTAKSCYQRQLQRDFQAQQKAEMKAFQADQKAAMKAKYKPMQIAINHNRDLSPNQRKAMLKDLAAQQKAEMKANMTDFKVQQKAQREDMKAIIKEEVKAAYG